LALRSGSAQRNLDAAIQEGERPMPDSDNAIRAKLDELDGLIASEQALSGEHREHLQDVVTDLRSSMQQALDASHHEGLAERFRELALKVEAAHPLLTRALRQLSEVLGGAGI
jgi:DNA-directed RNA polymerase specialized sigma24 family protein